MDMMLFALLLACVTCVASQAHHSTAGGAPCYTCTALPCDQPITCAQNEVCQMNYDQHSLHFRFSCWEAQECYHTQHLEDRHQTCCSDLPCLTTALAWLTTTLHSAQPTRPAHQHTTGGHVATLDYDAISCDQLANESCAVMDALCPYVNCTDLCKKCFKPIVTVPTTSSPTTGSAVTIDYDAISCQQLAGQGCGILDAVCPHVNCPDACQRCFKPIVTDTTTTTPRPQGGSGGVLDYSAITCQQLANQNCATMDVVCPHVNCPDVCRKCFAPIQTVNTTSSP